jgi:hypothetical protein
MSGFVPYVSVVVTSRNDDHGGDLRGRMQIFLDGLAQQCNRFRVPVELIMVEWNPPPDRPGLIAALRWPEPTGFFVSRIIEVPPELHGRLAGAQALPLFQMIAKNVGIRRARAPFVLATNIDILFSDELMQLLAERSLQPGLMYRVDRYDVMADVPARAPVEEQLDWCRTHLIRINAREGSFKTDRHGRRVLEEIDVADEASGVSFGPGWFPVEFLGPRRKPLRWAGENAELHVRDAGDGAVLCLDVEPGPGIAAGKVELRIEDATGAPVATGAIDRRQELFLRVPPGDGERTLRFVVQGPGRATPPDPRVLAWRILRCTRTDDAAWGKAHAVAGWSNLRIGRARGRSDRLEPAGLRMGRGWHAREQIGASVFRWASSPAEILIDEPGQRLLRLDLEPGPGVRGSHLHLEARDDDGAVLASGTFRHRRTVLLPLRAQTRAVMLRAIGGGAKIDGDERALDFRAFSAALVPRWRGALAMRSGEADRALLVQRSLRPRFDVARGTSEIRFGRGWHRMERARLTVFRWASNDAELFVRAGERDGGMLCATLEPGPGLGSKTMKLEVRDDRDRLVARGTITGRTRVHWPLPVSRGRLHRFVLRVENGGLPTPGDDRILNFRMLSCELVTQGSTRRLGHSLAVADAAAYDAGAATDVPAPDPSESAPFAEDLAAVFLHTNACGDFTLFDRDTWFSLRGYPEFEMFSMNIDSVLCFAAHHGGAREHVLPEPYRIYHIEHDTGSGWTPEGQEKLFRRIRAKGLDFVDYRTVLEWGREMRRHDKPIVFNEEDWGFAGEELREIVPGS